MPMIQITMLAGRTAEQKRKIARRVTDVVSEEAGTPRGGIVIAFYEVTKENYALGGQLIADKQGSS
jgi:4-oxalocrotonate tautomerase